MFSIIPVCFLDGKNNNKNDSLQQNHLIITMVQHSEGRDFYDDEYESEEEHLDERIDFSKLKFYGRQEELQALHHVYSSVCSETSQRGKDDISAAIISGYSGTGKSALVMQFVEEINRTASQQQTEEMKSCIFLRGKYETQCADPISAIVEALSGLSLFLQQGDSKELQRVRNDVQKAIGTELNVLTAVVPNLKGVFSEVQGCQSDLIDSKEKGWDRLKYVFQTFVKAICTKERPVVMFLDDLQWADSASLNLIATLLTDKSLRHFMFVGAIRSNEVDKNHPLTQRLELIKKTKTIEIIELLNLSIEDFGGFISASLELELDETKSLSEAIYSKTRGNIFFAMQVLEELQRNKVLYFSRISFQWEWNLSGVDMCAGMSDNVVDAVVSKIQKAPEKLQKALTITAYTRSSLDVPTLQLLMEIVGCVVEVGELLKILDTAVLEGLLSNKVGSPSYKFVHDRIQEAAYSLVPAGKERDALRWKLGSRLFELGSLPDSGEDWMLFVAADHLNSIHDAKPNSSSHQLDPLILARLNLEVGDKATKIAAFSQASGYLQRGVELLKQMPSCWQDHYDLSLQLYRNLSDVKLFQGNFDEGNKFGQDLLENANSLKDRIPTHISLAQAAARQRKYTESVKLYQDALKMMGQYPKRKIACMVKDYFAVKRFLRKNSDDDILILPMMTDETQLMTMSMFAELGLDAFTCGDRVEFMFATLRQLRISFAHGLCGDTANGLAYFSLALFGNMGDPEGGRRLSSLSCKVCELTNAKGVETSVVFIRNYFIDGWDQPHADVIASYQRAFKIGMEAGNLRWAFLNLWQASVHAFLAGFPLGPLVEATQAMKDWAFLYKFEAFEIDVILLPMLHLTGRADTPLNFEELAKFGPKADYPRSSQTYRLLDGYGGRLKLAIWFGEYSFAETMVAKLKEVPSPDASYQFITSRTYYSGLMASGMARQTGKKKYRSKAKKFAKEMKQLVRAKGINSLHRQLLMEAELVDSNKANEEKGKAKYDQAIAAAFTAGNLSDAGLACELAGEFLLRIGNTTTCRQYFTRSRSRYVHWGATVKVDHLDVKRGSYMDSGTEKTTASWYKDVDLDVYSGAT